MPKNKDTMKHRVRTLELAIEDAIKRMESNPNDKSYLAQQRNKIRTWEEELDVLKLRLSDGDQAVKHGI